MDVGNRRPRSVALMDRGAVGEGRKPTPTMRPAAPRRRPRSVPRAGLSTAPAGLSTAPAGLSTAPAACRCAGWLVDRRRGRGRATIGSGTRPMTAPPIRIETSLGPALVLVDDEWQLDLAELPVLHGLSVLSRALAEMALGQVRSDRVDVAVERKLRPRENPELIERLRIDHVKVDAEQATIESCPQLLETRLRALLGSLQRQRYREALFPLDAATPRALVAEFDDGSRQRYVLEHVGSRRDAGRGALRITIEGAAGRRLDLAALPHVRIVDVADRHFIAGSTRIAQTWTEALRRECARGRRSFFEARDPHSHLFQQLDQAGLGSLQRVSLQWAETALPFLLEGEPAATSELLKRVLLALEDRGVRRLLSERAVVRVDGGGVPVFLDIAQLGRVLELSLGQRRQ